MSLLDSPKNRRFERLFEFRRQQALAETALLRVQRRTFKRLTAAEAETLRCAAVQSLTRFR